MHYFNRTIAITACLIAITAGTIQFAAAADQDAPALSKSFKAPSKPADLPFFLIVDNRVTYSWMPKGVDPGMFSARPDGSINGTTPKSVYSFTHFDAWQYGTNFLTFSMLKSGHNDAASPCVAPGVTITGAVADCAGATEFFGLLRSTFGLNEIFDTKAFSLGPLRNISLEVGAFGETTNTFLAPADRQFVAGLQFAFDLPYKGFFNVAPLAYKEFNHIAFTQCGLFGPGVPGVSCQADGNIEFKTTWAIETNWYMDLGFLPENMQFFSISGRASWIGPKGDSNGLPALSGVGRFSTASKTEFNSEPIRLTFDAGKAFMGPKHAHAVDLWVAYSYWQNVHGLDHNATPGVCTVAASGQSTKSCTQSTVYTGITVKF